MLHTQSGRAREQGAKNRKSFVEYTLYYPLIHAPQTDTL